MHFRGDLGCKRGYEGWLAAEAKKRNPEIKVQQNAFVSRQSTLLTLDCGP